VILALSGGQEAGLVVVAAIFIGFALASSFVFPRSNPDFPGRRLPLFVLVVIGLLVAMLTAMVVLARESEAETHGGTEPAQTEPAPATTEGGTQTEGGTTGDAAAGKQVFATAGCTSCHTLADAGSTGTVGPNLDEAKPSHDLVVDRVTNGKGAMPPFKGQLSDQQIADVAAYVHAATSK
jgi:mono/diheme cytochrome c family protein